MSFLLEDLLRNTVTNFFVSRGPKISFNKKRRIYLGKKIFLCALYDLIRYVQG